MKAVVTIKKELQLLKRQREELAKKYEDTCSECYGDLIGKRANLRRAEQDALAMIQALEWVLHDGGLMRPLSYTKVDGV